MCQSSEDNNRNLYVAVSGFDDAAFPATLQALLETSPVLRGIRRQLRSSSSGAEFVLDGADDRAFEVARGVLSNAEVLGRRLTVEASSTGPHLVILATARDTVGQGFAGGTAAGAGSLGAQLVDALTAGVERFDSWRWGSHVRIGATIFLVCYIAVLRRIPGGGAYPFSTDAMGHLLRVRYLGEQIRLGNFFPQWLPDWYLGGPFVEFYPPAVTFLLGPVASVIGAASAYKLFVFTAIPLAGILTALLFRRNLGLQGTIAAGLMSSLSPWLMRTTFNEGHIPVTLFSVIMVPGLWLAIRLFEAPTPRKFIAFSLLSALIVLSHQLLALMFFVVVGFGLFLASIHRLTSYLGSLITVAAGISLGLGLSAFWLLPAMLPLDFAGTPNRGDPGRIFTYSTDFRIFDYGARVNPFEPYIGLGLVILGIVGFLLSYRVLTSRILFVIALASSAMAFGMNNPLVERWGLLQSFIFFERFWLIASLAFAVLSGYAVSSVTKTFSSHAVSGALVLLMMIMVFMVLFFDNKPYFDQVQSTDHPVWVEATKRIDDLAPPGRLVDFVGRPELAYFPTEVGRQTVFGWSIESTPHARRINLTLESIRSGHERYASRQLQQWWATGAYTVGADAATARFLASSGFTPLDPIDLIVPWVRSEASAFAFRQERNAVVVGKAAPGAAVLYPWLTLPESTEVRAVTPETLEKSRLVVLAEIPGDIPTRIASELGSYVSSGGSALILLSGDQTLWKAGLKTETIRLAGPMTLIDQTGSVLLEPIPIDRFGTPEAPWLTEVVSDSRAETLLSLRDADGVEHPVLSMLKLGSGAFYVAGASAHIHDFNTGDVTLMEAIEQVLRLRIAGLYTDDMLPGLEVRSLRFNGGSLDAVVDLGDEASSVLLSVTAGPHWSSIKVDGREVDSETYEGLVLVELQPGSHELALRQSATWPMWQGRAISFVSVISLVAVYWWWRRVPDAPESAGLVGRAAGATIIGVFERVVTGAVDGIFGEVPAEGDDSKRSESDVRGGQTER